MKSKQRLIVLGLLLAFCTIARADGAPSTGHILSFISQGDAISSSSYIGLVSGDDDLLFGEESDGGAPHIVE